MINNLVCHNNKDEKDHAAAKEQNQALRNKKYENPIPKSPHTPRSPTYPPGPSTITILFPVRLAELCSGVCAKSWSPGWKGWNAEANPNDSRSNAQRGKENQESVIFVAQKEMSNSSHQQILIVHLVLVRLVLLVCCSRSWSPFSP